MKTPSTKRSKEIVMPVCLKLDLSPDQTKDFVALLDTDDVAYCVIFINAVMLLLLLISGVTEQCQDIDDKAVNE